MIVCYSQSKWEMEKMNQENILPLPFKQLGMPIGLNGHAYARVHTHSSKKVISKKRKTRSVCQYNHPEVWMQYYGVGSPFSFMWIFKEETGLNTCTHPSL